jgi:hypothetical protein
MVKYEVKVKINAPAAEVCRLAASPEYAEWEAQNEGAVSAKATVRDQSGARLTLVIDRTDYSRGPGGMKTSKTERNIITQQWDLDAMSNTWSCRVPGPLEKLVDIHGVMKIMAQGDAACVMSEQGSVTIKAPIIGKVVEKSIAADIQRDFPKKAKFFEQKLCGG